LHYKFHVINGRLANGVYLLSFSKPREVAIMNVLKVVAHKDEGNWREGSNG
jgi:hypothetical protein